MNISTRLRFRLISSWSMHCRTKPVKGSSKQGHGEGTGNHISDSAHNSDAMTFSCITDQKWPVVLWTSPNMLNIVRKQPETLPSKVMIIVACEVRIPPASLVWEENQEWIWTTAVHCERFCLGTWRANYVPNGPCLISHILLLGVVREMSVFCFFG